MSVLTLHILSRGRAPEHDYCWMVFVPNGICRPDRPVRLDARAARLVQSDHPSLLLIRAESELLLFVTALESSRTDIQGRAIRSAIAMTAQARDEARLRGLAAWMLRTEGRAELERWVEEAVSSEPEVGFTVSNSLLDKLQKIEPASVEAEASSAVCRFAPNDEAHRSSLSDELLRTRLPGEDGPLVLVTGAVSQEHLESAEVWRGLSRLVTEASERPSREVRPPPKKEAAALRWRTMTVLVAMVAALLLLLSLWPQEAFPAGSGDFSAGGGPIH